MNGLQGKVSLPEILSMDPPERADAVQQTRETDWTIENSWEDVYEPFMFTFKCQADYENFMIECVEKQNLKICARFH